MGTLSRFIDKFGGRGEDSGTPDSTLVNAIKDYKLPKGYASLFQDAYNDNVSNVRNYLKGEKPLAEYSDGHYRSVVMKSGQELTFREGDAHPVPAGLWMDQYDGDAKAQGVTQAQYNKLSIEERARLHSKIQVENYIPGQYLNNKVKFYRPEVHYGTGTSPVPFPRYGSARIGQ